MEERESEGRKKRLEEVRRYCQGGVWRRVWWDSAGRGSDWVHNMYDDLLRLTPPYEISLLTPLSLCDVFARVALSYVMNMFGSLCPL